MKSLGGVLNCDPDVMKPSTVKSDILREFNSAIVGASHGEGYDNTEFNVGVSGRTSLDMPRQAQDLIDRMRNKLD
ncbi:hypothetical protein OSTOST_25585, partial [Ostertagia ostertagi]